MLQLFYICHLFKVKRVIIAIGLGFLLTACSEQGECLQTSSNIMRIGFYNISDRKPRTIALDSITLEGTDFLFYKAKSGASVDLPLNPEWEKVTYNLYFGGLEERIDITYEMRAFAQQPACPVLVLYTLGDVTGQSISEVFYSQRQITSTLAENVKIYF